MVMRYDKSLFASTANFYTKYRPKYPPKLLKKLVDTFSPNQEDVLLDLGCGTGELAIPLAKYFQKVIAWDPDPEMLELAKQNAQEQGASNIVFELKSSDSLPSLTKKVKVCVMGQSFHWMDGANTLAEIKKHLTSGGGVAILGIKIGIHIYTPDGWVEPVPATALRNKAIYETVVKFLGIERRAGETTFKTSYQPFTEMLEETGFESIQEQTFEEMRERTTDETLGYIYSTSWGNKNQLGDKAMAFDEELMGKLGSIEADGVFSEKIVFSLLTAKG